MISGKDRCLRADIRADSLAFCAVCLVSPSDESNLPQAARSIPAAPICVSIVSMSK